MVVGLLSSSAFSNTWLLGKVGTMTPWFYNSRVCTSWSDPDSDATIHRAYHDATILCPATTVVAISRTIQTLSVAMLRNNDLATCHTIHQTVGPTINKPCTPPTSMSRPQTFALIQFNSFYFESDVDHKQYCRPTSFPTRC